MKYVYLFVFFLSVCLSSFAQSNYKPGYVVDLKNDTLKGFIDYKEWENNPKAFTFKSNLNQSPQTFTNKTANAFGITGIEHYHKFAFSKSNSTTNINTLHVGVDTSRSSETTFLKVIEQGKKVSLYSFTDSVKTRFYISTDKNVNPRELDYYVFYVVYNSNSYQTAYTYRDQLNEIVSYNDITNPQLSTKIKYAYYKESDLKAIVELINGEKPETTKQSGVSGIRYFAGAGARFGKLETGGGATFFPEGTNASSTSAFLSGGVDILTNKYTQKFVFRAEINLSKDHYIIPPTPLNGIGTTGELNIKQTNAQLSPQIIYNIYSTNNLKVFIDGGVNLNFSSYSGSYIMNFNNTSTIEKKNYPEFEKFYLAFNTKAGFVISNKIELYVSRGFSAPITQAQATPASVSNYQAGINYLF